MGVILRGMGIEWRMGRYEERIEEKREERRETIKK